MSSKTNFKVYMDVQIGASGAGRIVFQLFNDLTPKTSENFRGLCTGEYGRANNTKLHYLNTKFHRIIDGFVLQGGDITHAGGKGGFSIYGRTFNDQSFARTHSCAGLLSMANCGRNTNSSQFFITLKAAPHLDGKHVVFGQVIDGMQVVRKISKVPIDKQDKPRIPVILVDCGQVGDYKAFLRYDPFKKEVFQQIRERKQKIIKDQYMIRKMLGEGMDTNEAYEYKKKLEKCEKEMMELNKQEQLLEAEREEGKGKGKGEEKEKEERGQVQRGPVVSDRMREKFGQTVVNKFLDLKLRINEAKVLNSKAALQQQIRENDTNYHKMVKKQQWLQKRKHAEQQIQSKGISKSKLYMNRNALKKQEQEEKKDKTQEYGWNVYTEDAYYSAHEKRCLGLTKNEELNKEREAIKEREANNGAVTIGGKPSEQALNRLQADITRQQEKRSVFSRKRLGDEDETVNYINQKNKVYNQKLQRNFKTYASAIRTSLEINSHKN